ncbi:DUF2946 family protein [Amaricoccus solimangrovi]|uniref:DUF2946 domain-containing protein n=1 Tax=Amaricoccus solimangrovi TaxID=2589815 RepID=A0A501WPQ4_9RHOB|nr:DUF2946 family protein [Amaricoccus solimangrovi]TPE51439.1 hypothetical protein FJM51_09375 [Amaricoccus solimangrovi]
MSARLARSLLIVLTILGLLAPRVSAVLAFAAPGVRTIVICTGDALRTIRIDEEGDAVPVVEHSDHCVLAHAADTAQRIAAAPVLAPVPGPAARADRDLVPAGRPRAARPPPRAPPAA